MMSGTTSSRPLLKVENLSVSLFTETATARPVAGVNYSVEAGRTLAVVGESGSGKTIMNLAPLGLLPAGVTADFGGAVHFEGRDLLRMSPAELRQVRGGGIGVVFQDPLSALNPARRIGSQIVEVIELHLGLTAAAAEARAADLLTLVGIPDPVSRLRQYPHELSGGMRQRVMIAIGIAGEPKLLIADEPTTALDVTVQAQIIHLLKDLQKRLGMAAVLITHDIGVVAGMADTIAVMYAGTVVETGEVEDVLLQPQHPYTRGLLDSVPQRSAPIGSAFKGLPGLPPDLSRRIGGCAFAPRCAYSQPECRSVRPSLKPVTGGRGHLAACPVVNPLNLAAAQ
jgi:peptide/nickel transport system ATP-binding protein